MTNAASDIGPIKLIANYLYQLLICLLWKGLAINTLISKFSKQHELINRMESGQIIYTEHEWMLKNQKIQNINSFSGTFKKLLYVN